MPENVLNRLSRWGFVYWSPALYRWVMALIRPKGRQSMFAHIAREIGDRSTLELCCGQGELVPFLGSRKFVGIDQNPAFVKPLVRRGQKVIEGDVLSVQWPTAQCIVMIDSLYHFMDRLEEFMGRLLAHPAQLIILSESVNHVALRKEQWLVRFVHWGTRVDGKTYPGRFTEESLRSFFERYKFGTIRRDGNNLIGILKRTSG